MPIFNVKDENALKNINNGPGWCGSVVEYQPVNQRVAGWIPSLGHMPGMRAGPQ